MGTQKPNYHEILFCETSTKGLHERRDGSNCSCPEGLPGWWKGAGHESCEHGLPVFKKSRKADKSDVCMICIGDYYEGKNPYLKRERISHTYRWEKGKPLNSQVTLRIDKNVHRLLLKKKGRKGRDPKGRGRPPKGIRHLLRRESLLVFHTPLKDFAGLLDMAGEHKPGKKIDVTLNMPNLENAVHGLLDQLFKQYPVCKGHHLLNKSRANAGWAPILCRLIETRILYIDRLRALDVDDEQEHILRCPECEFELVVKAPNGNLVCDYCGNRID